MVKGGYQMCMSWTQVTSFLCLFRFILCSLPEKFKERMFYNGGN